MKPPRVLPMPTGVQALLDGNPRAFYAGCAAARDGLDENHNPYREPGHYRPMLSKAWAAGWLSVHEGWCDTLDHTGGVK